MENGTGTTPAQDQGTSGGEPGRRALVIGAGIGGLTAAAGLADRGWQVTVLERSATLEPVGAAISLAPNGQRALDRVGPPGRRPPGPVRSSRAGRGPARSGAPRRCGCG
ncbi:FAD-dependent oxidoreductase, partial [Streptomyces albidoflavus]|uniref:FAD-dependent oxidoreductase n=1 Tax=Streptomyces albidoflavus TaxID=1886 RepID=UPI0033AF2ED4